MLQALYAKGMASGKYETRGDPAGADIISIHEWGAFERDEQTGMMSPGEVNLDLAGIALALQAERWRPIVGTMAVHSALVQASQGRTGVDYLVGYGTRTTGELRTVKRAMDENGYQLPIHLANAVHIGRVGLQARRQGITDFVVPAGLPGSFRPESRQFGIRSRARWVAHEIAAVAYLRTQGEI